MTAKPTVPAARPKDALATTEGALSPMVETTALAAAAQMTAAVESRYKLALLRPRDWTQVRRQVLAACARPRFAEEAKYRLPRGDKAIEGLSVRFAEEAVRWLTNVMVEAVVVFDDDTRRIVRVIATDLEANLTYPTDVVVEKTVERRNADGRDVLSTRMNSQNQRVYLVRATDDEILMKQNSLVSKALRNAILRFLPADMQEEALAAVGTTLRGTAKEEGAVDRLLRAFAALNVSQADVEGYLGHGLDTLTPDEYDALRGLGEAMREGDLDWATVIARTPATVRGRPARAVRSAGYDQTPAPVKTETVRMADKPKPGPKAAEGYALDPETHCPHGTSLDAECPQCLAESQG